MSYLCSATKLCQTHSMEKITIKNSLGQNIAAVVHYPETKTDKLAVLCPGNLDSKDYQHLVKLAEVLSARGYTAVRFDPAGTWESEGKTDLYTMTQYLKDVKSVLDFMLSQKPYTEILLGGHSRGGQVSLLAAARDSRITKVLAIMPSSRRTINENQAIEWQKQGFRISQRDVQGSDVIKEYTLPYSHLVDQRSYDVETDVKNIHVPIVFITGELEKTVLPEFVMEIFNRANEPKKFINIAGIGHNYRHNLAEVEIVNKEILKAMEL